jgi:type VI secretion system protein ImpC
MAMIPMQFSFSTHQTHGARKVDEDDAFRILVLADLGGSPNARKALPLMQRKPLGIDIDNFDKVMARLAPQLEITLDGAQLGIGFQSIDDFHPDRLFARLAPFAELRQLRTALADPAQFRSAAAQLGMTAAGSSTPATDATPVDASDMERLLGRKPVTPPQTVPASPTTSAVDISTWLRRVVTPHVVQDFSGEQAQLLAAVDTAISANMRGVLHHPAFQALESNWRCIDRLVRQLDPGQRIQLLLQDIGPEELAQDIHAHVADLSQSALHRHLCGPQTESPNGQRWSLLVSDLRFDAHLDDLQLLASLGAMAARAGAPLLAAARPSLIGCAELAQLTEPKAWQPVAADVAEFWSTLRRSPIAPWVGLALPRVLTRLPYGQHSDPTSAFAFEEMLPRQHEHYLWASPAFYLALLAGLSFVDSGWDMALDAQLTIDDLPSHIYQDDGEAQLQACAEVCCSESAGEAVLKHGAMVLLSLRQRNAVRLMRWQSIAEPARALQGAWA